MVSIRWTVSHGYYPKADRWALCWATVSNGNCPLNVRMICGLAIFHRIAIWFETFEAMGIIAKNELEKGNKVITHIQSAMLQSSRIIMGSDCIIGALAGRPCVFMYLLKNV